MKYAKRLAYLGGIVNSNASIDDEIVNRIAKTTAAFGKPRYRFWNNRGIRVETKIRVHKAVVLTTLSYVAETWTPYRTHIRHLDALSSYNMWIYPG